MTLEDSNKKWSPKSDSQLAMSYDYLPISSKWDFNEIVNKLWREVTYS